MKIHGLNKTTLLDYPEHVAASIFLGGCNFKCPFCHNGDLVLCPDSQPVIEEEEVLAFLKKRKGILTGVCITGGEPTLEADLADFLHRIKEIGYLIKLDTNGYRPEIIKKLTEEGLIDYIAMDIKNCRACYGKTAGLKNMDTERIRESIRFIMEERIPYEFRTTVVKELHEAEDIKRIGEEIAGAKAYFLQLYKDSERVIQQGFHAYEKKEMEQLLKMIKPYVPNASLRGID